MYAHAYIHAKSTYKHTITLLIVRTPTLFGIRTNLFVRFSNLLKLEIKTEYCIFVFGLLIQILF